uniref:Putative secreted peptide n=1 Tax=Anopheles braziliensis TaxID=58242 RepID=A0A2M3ZSI0_9DIPT
MLLLLVLRLVLVQRPVVLLPPTEPLSSRHSSFGYQSLSVRENRQHYYRRPSSRWWWSYRAVPRFSCAAASASASG